MSQPRSAHGFGSQATLRKLMSSSQSSYGQSDGMSSFQRGSSDTTRTFSSSSFTSEEQAISAQLQADDAMAKLRRFRTFSRVRMFMHDVVESKYFGGSILSVIILNTALIAVQTDRVLDVNYGWFFTFVDSVFLGIYIFELMAKFYVWRKTFFESGWNNFDLFIVVMSCMEVVWILLVGSLAGFNPKIFRLLRLFRAIRAFRALRVLRTITFFQSLQIIVSTLLRSIPAWGSISLLLLLVLYIFAIIGVTLYAEVSPDRFGTIWLSSFSLFQLFTLDDWFGFYDDVKDRDNSMIYFLIIFIVLETFIFINLFVAVIVNNLEHLQKKNHMRIKQRRFRETRRTRRKMRRMNTIAALQVPEDEVLIDSDHDGVAQKIVAKLSGDKQRAAHALMILAALDNAHDWYQSLQHTLDNLVELE